ncbi:MAG: alpha-2-macroglobulin, partial [Lentisphaerae bacterium]|nr:alpha-2-macroglobulin [Lentisphaerota bacterium]
MKRRICPQIGLLCLIILMTVAASNDGAQISIPDLRQQAQQMNKDGNFQEALDIFMKLALNTNNHPDMVGLDFNEAINNFSRLNRSDEIDDFREQVVSTHPDNWRLLEQSALSYFNGIHYGYIIAGKFHRGHHRGGGRYVNSIERDRVRALQLMDKGRDKSANERDKAALAQFYMSFAAILIGHRGYSESWQLQYLTDLSKLPDYDEGYHHAGHGTGAAPVHADGSPVFHNLPKSYEDASTDGERWRWMLHSAMRLNPNRRIEILTLFANFLHNQFGVQTMAQQSWFFRHDNDDEDFSGTYALHTLGDDETIARLATGIKRFRLPDEHNYISIYREIADANASYFGEQALNQLASIFENRRQYSAAADYWQRNIDRHKDIGNRKQNKLNQILDNWGRFEPVMSHPKGRSASVEYRFRNGTLATFTAHRILVEKLLADVKTYLKSNPKTLDWRRVNIGNIGYMLVQENQTQYIAEQIAEWDLPLSPKENHFDRRITVTTPLDKPGAYLLTAQMKNGNTSRIIIWITDTAIVKKPLEKKALFYIADSVSGRPLPGTSVEFFGYRQENIGRQKSTGRHYNILTTNFVEHTNQDGQIYLSEEETDKRYQWIIMVRDKEPGTDNPGRLAYLGFSSIWHGRYLDREYNQTKVFTITDRPVYRPNQSVKFKFWIRHAKYDLPETSSFANRQFTVQINNPKGEKVFESDFMTDAYGGIAGEFPLPSDAALGIYSLNIVRHGGGTFRVEEYKKPEFEVEIATPSEPIMLGDKISTTITARYYFGAPVTDAKVRYKVLRLNYDANWYPVEQWDWFYDPGYWWFAYNYTWYPGWRDWGCKRPHWRWWPTSHTPPEIIAEAEAKIGKDGTFQINIDTSPALEMHGDTDHQYEITVEVTDQSRRTIVGKGSVLVAKSPFKVYAWVDRGHYRIGDVVHANFSARTPDGKPVKGRGLLKLLRISYINAQPIENIVQSWDLNTDDEGTSNFKIKASEAGQYRLSYKLTDPKGRSIEGGYIFCVMGKDTNDKHFRFNDIELVPDKKQYAVGDKIRL